MSEPKCSVNECDRTARVTGLCMSHYKRKRDHGDPLLGPPIRSYSKRSPGATLADRFWVKVQTGAPTDCWPWQAATDQQEGYGRFQLEGRTARAHRVAYELTVGPIPDGLHLDHLCRNRACVNPAHLEPVTSAENTRRGIGNGSETHCPQGHPYSGTNLYVYGGRRYCRTCRRAHYAARVARQAS